jgi:uncharacterized membrane protein YhaH (DUF805 family)
MLIFIVVLLWVGTREGTAESNRFGKAPNGVAIIS